ncbi:MAG: hypothetical protein PVJ57_09120 [Phycisphaerae bacterium]|jgi:hypothetical protein
MTKTKQLTLAGLLATMSVLIASAGAPPVPATPASVDDILYVQPFTLEKAYASTWRAEQPKVDSGLLLVLKVNPDLVYPRQTAEPVLYVGDQTAERVNVGYVSGHVVAIVPGEVDLEKALAWFGDPDLPERVTAEKIRQQTQQAVAASITPVPTENVRKAVTAGGKTLKLADYEALRREAAELIKTYAPDETERADNIQAPRVGG